jgi:hypothetical protein
MIFSSLHFFRSSSEILIRIQHWILTALGLRIFPTTFDPPFAVFGDEWTQVIVFWSHLDGFDRDA